MKIIPANKTTKEDNFVPDYPWAKVKLPVRWKKIISLFVSIEDTSARSIQYRSLQEQKILNSNKNLIIAAPTNSGKSLIGWLTLLKALDKGKRVVWLAPLKVLAEENFEKLASISPELEKILKRKIRVRITTGDYRLEDEHFSQEPPSAGEIIIATPERFEAILRNPKNQKWIEGIGGVCVDEAHLISSKSRGSVLEYIITLLLQTSVPPQIILLSASLGNTKKAEKWLRPCMKISETTRYPTVEKEVWFLEKEENADEIICKWTEEIIREGHQNCCLIFVYQTASADKLAFELKRQGLEAKSFHSRKSINNRKQVKERFVKGDCRIIVATTSLSLGINLPATHVLIRDRIFYGAKNLAAPEILQMMGRAGRGDTSGKAIVLIKEQGNVGLSDAEQFAEEIKEEVLPELSSSFQNSFNGRNQSGEIQKVAERVAALLFRQKNRGSTDAEIQKFFSFSLGGKNFTEKLPGAMLWMQDPGRLLSYKNPDDDKNYLTRLGKQATEHVLPLEVAAGVGQLFRDLFYIDKNDQMLKNLKIIDILLLVHLFGYGRNPGKRYSLKLAEGIESWMERNPKDVSLLYRDWIRGSQGENYRGAELLGSLGIVIEGDHDIVQSQQKIINHTHISVFRSILIFERSKGVGSKELERIWNIKGFSEIEEGWRDELLWLLYALVSVFEVRSYYYFLKEEINCGEKRLKRIENIFKHQRIQVFQLLDQLKYCSPLGAFYHQVKTQKKLKGVGKRSIRKIEESGIDSLVKLSRLGISDLLNLGLTKSNAIKIKNYLDRRSG